MLPSRARSSLPKKMATGTCMLCRYLSSNLSWQVEAGRSVEQDVTSVLQNGRQRSPVSPVCTAYPEQPSQSRQQRWPTHPSRDTLYQHCCRLHPQQRNFHAKSALPTLAVFNLPRSHAKFKLAQLSTVHPARMHRRRPDSGAKRHTETQFPHPRS